MTTHVRITPPAQAVADVTLNTMTTSARARGRLDVPTMKPVDETCACTGCHSPHTAIVGTHSTEGPVRHCRTCGCSRPA